jgi:hypothetical protein
VRHQVLGVPILGFKVGNDFWIGSVAQPKVIVEASIAVLRDFFCYGFCNRGLNY